MTLSNKYVDNISKGIIRMSMDKNQQRQHHKSAKKDLISFDYAMKYILRDKSDYSIIENFISSLLATANYKPIKILNFLESESNKDEARGKRVLADLVVEDTEGVKYIVEIERNERLNFMHKACFSSSRLIVDSIGQGQNYSNIVKVIHISLLYFDIGGSSVYHGKTIVRDVDKDQKLDLQLRTNAGTSYDLHDIFPEYFIISIPAFHDEIKQGIDEWLYLMKHEEILTDFKEQYIKLAAERLNFLKMPFEKQTQYMKYQLEMVDIKEEFRTAEIKGLTRGRAEGMLEERKNLINKMRNGGMQDIDIAKVLDLDINTVFN